MLLKVMSSCDMQAAVYMADDAAYRVVKHTSKKSVLEVLEIVNTLDEESIVRTEVCSDACIPDGINVDPDSLVLKHKKIIFASYPHEWCASMLKDAALFHLALSERLLSRSLFLKDAHPWNILFEKGRPVFIDFTSIVTKQSLFAEEYLDANKRCAGLTDEIRLAQVLKEIFERMYLPYFFNPLCAYAYGVRSSVAKGIERSTLNTATSVFSMHECLPAFRLRLSAITTRIELLKLHNKIKRAVSRLIGDRRPLDFFREVSKHVRSLAVENKGSAYSNYYQLKGENQGWSYSLEWNDKQKVVYKALNVPEISTVLDVACNTGWYSVLAEKLGKHVVAVDIDEACVDVLYNQVRTERLDILPLVMNVTELTQDRYSTHDGGSILVNAPERICCDSLIALGIFHHLTLGLGLSFEEVLDHLVPLCRKQMVIEFVDANDPMIQNEPSFFPAYFKNKELLAGYSVNKLTKLCEERGFRVRHERSHPATRSLLVCERPAAT